MKEAYLNAVKNLLREDASGIGENFEIDEKNGTFWLKEADKEALSKGFPIKVKLLQPSSPSLLISFDNPHFKQIFTPFKDLEGLKQVCDATLIRKIPGKQNSFEIFLIEMKNSSSKKKRALDQIKSSKIIYDFIHALVVQHLLASEAPKLIFRSVFITNHTGRRTTKPSHEKGPFGRQLIKRDANGEISIAR